MTIVELQPEEFARVLPLYREARKPFPLISAVIQNKQRGQVFADERESPHSALVVTDFGFMFLAGAAQEGAFNEELSRLFATGNAFKPSYLLWYSPPAYWQKKLDSATPGPIRRRERMRFEFHAEGASWLKEPVQCPAGLELRKLSSDLISKTERFGLKLDSRFWASAADFLANGLGVCLMQDSEVVSLCYTAAIADCLGEIDVVTQTEFRGSGLANCVAQQLIRECLSTKIIPTWDCFLDNIGSRRLGEKLEFTPLCSYPFYSFNVPIEVGEGEPGETFKLIA